MIARLEADEPSLYSAYRSALRQSDATAHLLLKSGRYPLTGQGDVNTYSVFAETMRTIISPDGAAGLLSPTGLATDKTTAPFFSDTLSNRRLYAFYDFENEDKIFRDVDHRMRFAMTVMTGWRHAVERSRFAFLTRHLVDLPSRRFELTPAEVLEMNPNTGTLPMFRTRVDADITLGIFGRHPVLIRDDATDGNPWNLSFARLFDMANDSGMFRQPDDLAKAELGGWSLTQGNKEYVPLYEAKLLNIFDHRFSTYRGATQAQLNVGALPRLSAKEHDDPDVEPLARYWVDRAEVHSRLDNRWRHDWLLGFRDITNTGNERTFLPAILPKSAVAHVFPVALVDNPASAACLHGTWSILIFDYVARQKLSGTHMTYNIVKQIACPVPARFAEPTKWKSDIPLSDWVRGHVLELSYTSWRLKPYADDLGDDGAPFHWDPERRALLRADLDGGFLHIYGLDRGDAEHVLDSFTVVRKYDERDYSEYRTKRLVLEAYDRMARAIANGGMGWEPLADPPAGLGPRHENRK